MQSGKPACSLAANQRLSVKSHFLPQRSSVLARCIFVVFCLSSEASFHANAQTPAPSPSPALPQDILKGNTVFGQYTTFRNIPSATSVAVFVDVTLTDPSASPGNLQIAVFPGCPDGGTSRPPAGTPQFLLWDHELLLDAAGHPVTHIQSVFVLPPSILNISAPPPGDVDPDCDSSNNFIYTIQVIDDTFGSDTPKIGTFNSCSLTVNPVNAGHVGPPTLNVFAGTQNQPVPTQIDYGQPLTLVAAASGNPSSFTIARLGIVITDLQSQQTYKSPEIFQASSSAPAPTLTYTPPILAPGVYQITARAIDSAGFSKTVSTNLTVRRLFGLFSVSLPSPTPTPNPDRSITFSAQLTLKNNTAINSTDLRVRLLEVASGSFLDVDGPPTLPPPSTPQGATVGPVSPLPAGAMEQVSVSGTVQAPIFDTFPTQQPRFINFHIFAVLDEFVDGQWITIDSLKVIDGVQDQALDFGGPGGGMNDPSPGLGGTPFDPLILNSLAIDGPPSAAPGQHYMATATAKNSAGTTSKSADVTAQSQWSVNCPAGVFAPPSGAKSVQISASFTLGGVTQMMTKSVMVTSAPTPTPTPTVHISVSSTQVTEGGSATFQISASPNTVRPIAVNYSLSGKSTFGVDYTLSGGLGQSGQITIPLGADSTAVTLTTVADHIKEKKESVTMTLNAGTGYKASKPKKAKVKFVDAP
jgi:hypothetical protein